jgi:hypothetical protein
VKPRSGQRRVPVAWRLAVAALACASWSCGAGESTRAAREAPAPEFGVTSVANACPNFTFYMVLPKAIRAEEAAWVAVRATDVDSDDDLITYRWSATSGAFVEPEVAFTEYSCADAGPQILTIVAADAEGCERTLDLDVTCDEAALQ